MSFLCDKILIDLPFFPYILTKYAFPFSFMQKLRGHILGGIIISL
jgi:hypothetical protein